jgi:cytochrome P450
MDEDRHTRRRPAVRRGIATVPLAAYRRGFQQIARRLLRDTLVGAAFGALLGLIMYLIDPSMPFVPVLLIMVGFVLLGGIFGWYRRDR